MKLEAVPALTRHARLVAASMRDRDIAELRAGWDKDPIDAIREAMTESYFARTLLYGMEPLAMYGLAPLMVLGGASRVWIFATRAIDAHPFAFARASRRLIRELYLHGGMLTNLVDVKDEPVMRWLDWLGASFPSVPVARGGRLFGQFILKPQTEIEEGARCQQA